MPADLTIFAAQYVVFIAAVLAAAVLVLRLRRRSRFWLVHWALAVGVMLALSYALGLLGAAVYNDPRPFTTSHSPPLIAHAPDNGFPSDHALLAAAIAAAVALADPWWALLFVALAVVVDWARVGAGLHHVVDVAGSSAFVAVATLVALLLAARVARWLAPRLPGEWNRQPEVPSREQNSR